MENNTEELTANLKIENMENNEIELRKIIKEKIDCGITNGLSFLIKSNKLLYKFILNKTNFLNKSLYNIQISQMVWHIHNNITDICLCKCGEEVKFVSLKRGYFETCSLLCARKEDRAKSYQTMLSNFGPDNIFNRAQACDTLEKNFGVRNPSQIPGHMDKVRFTKALNHDGDETFNNRPQALITVREIYNVDHISQIEETKQKIKDTKEINHDDPNFNNRPLALITVQDKYNVDHVSQIPGHMDKVRFTKALNHDGDETFNNMDKNKATRALNHPENPTFNNRPLAVETSMINWKTTHHMQNSEYFEQWLKNSFKFKEYTMPSGKIVMIQGWENITLDHLLIIFNEEDIFIGQVNIENEIGKIWYETDKSHRYMPDAYVKSINKVFETKSDYTYEDEIVINKLKKQATIDKGVNFEFVIYDKKFNFIDEY